ncbi:MAG: NADH-quinone oxidoreductase subunit NuoK [Alphaproteobacteria bacterium]|jgi:NADH:ubiquinone oxidoreductase subunit K
MMIGVSCILAVSVLLFLFGLWGVLRHRRDLMRCLMALQLAALGILFNFSLGSALNENETGFIFALFVICLGGVQIAVSLTLFLLYFRKHEHLESDRSASMKG